MNANTRLRRIFAMVLAMVMVFSLMPVSASAATSGNEADTIFFATDRHEEASKLQSLLQALEYVPGLVVLGGDHVNNTNSGSLASITSEIQSVYPGVQTFYTYAAHDPNVSEDSSNPYAFARTGEVYEGEDYYVYGVDQDHMQSASNAAAASAAFQTWAASADESKVIFVMCHMPIHSRRGDNAGGATWMTALNEVGQSHDVVFLWGHNHTGESSADTSVYFVGVGGSLTPQGGSTGTISFTYMNAGYIKNGYCSMVVINDDSVDVTRYTTSGSVNATHSIERRFAVSHIWEETGYVAATCTADGSRTTVCSDCGETKTTVIPATGHDYTAELVENCVGSFTCYTCTLCGDSYSEQNATETTYDAVSSLTEGESYVIVASNYALTYGSSAGKTSVTVSGGSITSDVTEAMIFTYENGMLRSGSSYVNVSSSSSGSSRPGSSSSRTITFGTSGASVSYSSSKLKLGSYYLYYSSNSGFSARSSGSTVTLYQVNEGYAITGEHTYESVTVDPSCVTDGSVTYTCTACGDTYTETIAASGSHAYTAETVEATCAESGSVTYTCTVCADTYTEVIPATGAHTSVTETIEATCTEPGSVTTTCLVCGYTSVEVLEAMGHSYTAVVTAPTCTEAGFTAYTCVCGDAYIADETAALGHSYSSVTAAPTCTVDGSVTYTCACGDTYVEMIPATGHTYESAVTAPTCTDSGFTVYTCACGDTYIADETAALGHDFETVTVEATCTTAGFTANTCVRCGEGTVTDETEALGHAYTSVTTEATCTEPGCTTYTCGRCADTYTDNVTPALGHSNETVTVDATCTASGSVTTTCLNCGETAVETIAALGHDPETVTVAATCTEPGSVTATCLNCGETSTDVLEALGHAYETVTNEATCTNNGSITTTCLNCGEATVEIIEAPGHAYTSVVTAPTCTTAGCTTYTCTCGDTYTTDETAALGHAHTAVVTAPTCTASGYTTYTCTCGDTYTTDETAALGHSYSAIESDGYMVYTCQNCGDSYSEALTPAYTYDNVTAFTSGDSYVITVYSGSKYYALSHSGNSISAVEITVSGNQITSEITEALLWTYADSKLSYVDGGTAYYLYASKASGWMGWFGSATLSVSTTNSSSVSFSNSRVTVDSYYLRYSGGNITVNRSATTAYLFRQTEN